MDKERSIWWDVKQDGKVGGGDEAQEGCEMVGERVSIKRDKGEGLNEFWRQTRSPDGVRSMGVRSWGAGVWRGAGNEFGDESGVGHGVRNGAWQLWLMCTAAQFKFLFCRPLLTSYSLTFFLRSLSPVTTTCAGYPTITKAVVLELFWIVR